MLTVDPLKRSYWSLARRIAHAQTQLHSASVALTFDDGPDPRVTPSILEALDELDASATFFLVGSSAVSYPEIVQRIVERGHAIGSHSWTHPHPHEISARAARREYARGRAAVEGIARRSTALFRPPTGYVDLRGAAVIRSLQLDTWLWSIDSGDWRTGATASDVVAAVGAPEPGDVVLLHDGLVSRGSAVGRAHSVTADAVRTIVLAARARGLDFDVLRSTTDVP
jgi:peptidoglycan/xylan/chitin deacetylase (PgdA/CDA1 family)